MSWPRILRIAFIVAATLTLLYSLMGILLTGPIVVGVRPFDFEVAPSVERLRADVAHLCGELSPRGHDDIENLNRAADWIAAQFRGAGLTVTIQEYRAGERTYRNVIAMQPGSDPFRGAVVVGAHYDAYSGYPGADDNASGIAALLELARTVPQRFPQHTRYLVAFSTGEEPFQGSDEMGSYHFARWLQRQEARVDLMVALEGVGVFRDTPGSQQLPSSLLRLLYPDRGDFLAVVGDLSQGPAIERVRTNMLAMRALPVHSFRAPAFVDGIHRSDHSAFRRLGLPAVMVTDTTGLRDDAHHTPRDTPERLDYERMAAAVRALQGVLWEGSLEDARQEGSDDARPF